MTKLVSLFIIFGPVQETQTANKRPIKVLKKYANQAGQSIDESLMSTLCLPKVEFVDQPKEPKFQTFLVTKEDGQMLYGSGLIVYEPVSSHQSANLVVVSSKSPPSLSASQARRRSINADCNNQANTKYASFCYTLITGIPFIHATRSLLDLLWEKKCDDNVIRCIMNIPLPARRACLRIVPPPPSSFDQPSSRNSWFNSTNSSRSSSINTSTESSKNLTLVKETVKTGDNGSPRDGNTNHQPTNTNQQPLYIRHKFIDDIYLYRGLADLPILDYPLRELFSFLQIDDLLLAFACILMEFRTLIISQDNYKLMMVGETLTTLLLPLKWCNVYVPILPPEYGATYLDAPTSYIMGINTQVTELPENLNHIQCRIYCDESRVVCDADSLALPLFLNDIKKDILKIFEQHHLEYEPSQFNSFDSSNSSFNEYNQRQYDPMPLASSGAACLPLNSNGKPFTYLDDLKFNRAIRVLFINTIRRNILANYERYIVDVPETSKEIRQFDIVSYLSDQPEFMHTFLSKFLETQLFVSFIDENAKRIQRSWLSIFDMDPDELSEHFTDEMLELAFKKAQRVQLKNLATSEQTGDIEIKTVPASPMKLRHRLPALTSLKNRLQNLATTKSTKFAGSQFSSIDQSDITGPSSAGLLTTSPGSKTTAMPFDLSTPVIHRNSIANISLKGHLKHDGLLASGGGAFSPTIDTVKESNDEFDAPRQASRDAPIKSQASCIHRKLNPVPNGKILELINEVKDLTKGILIESMGDVMPINRAFSTTAKQDIGSCDGIALIGSLCDLIERVWAHGAFSTSQEANQVASCPLWNHLMAFAKLKFLALGVHQEFSDGSHLNVLSPPTSYRAEALTELDMLIMLDRGTIVLPNKAGGGGSGVIASNAIKSSLKWLRQGVKRSNFDKTNGSVMSQASRELVNDLIIINKLQDVKTGFGRARAFIRLSLERKSLCKHLKTLLSDQSLLEGLYKPYAFLMHDDEREQFLMYLLTLNAVDLPCFTSTFVNVINSRRMRLTA